MNKITRRNLLRLGTVSATGSLLGRFQPAMAGPFVGADFDALVPADKKLTPQWVRSLYERGEPEWYSGEELKHIGMPVGGICCGQVYLGGDGRLWHWDIFNRDVAPKNRTRGPHYAKPMPVKSEVDIGFTIRVRGDGGETIRTLDQAGFPQVRFRGAYPIGFVEYRDDAFPVDVSLEAFSPFAPLDVDASSLPLTVMRYTVRNSSKTAVEVSLAGALTNPVLLHSGKPGGAEFVNRILQSEDATCLHCTVERPGQEGVKDPRPEIVFEDFESETYEGWTVEGTAFGSGPVVASKMPAYQGKVGAKGERLVNSHNTRQGEDAGKGDAHTGVMTSKPFKIERRYIHALIGGGSNAEQTALQLLIEDKVVSKLAGKNQNAMEPGSLHVARYEGKTARLRIVDHGTEGWGNIGVDHIVFSDRPTAPPASFDARPDMGDMTLAVLDDGEGVYGAAQLRGEGDGPLFESGAEIVRDTSSTPPRGIVGKTRSLAPGEQATVSFAVAWRFPNQASPVPQVKDRGHYYAERFASSLAAVHHHAAEHEKIYARTRLWHDTWNDSTLPHWLLDRTFVNTSALATSTCLRFEGGRFWGWEGVNCCPGTCTHVWHYAQSVGRVFPELERITREQVDFNYDRALKRDGAIFYRAEGGKPQWDKAATDGQCGTILRVYREHTMSPNAAFLERIWPRVKKSIEFLIREDADGNGVLEGQQHNTLDASWYGPVSWLSSLYLAALRAGAAMARELKDESFATECDRLVESGRKWLSENLFNGEFFYHKRDPRHPDAFGSGIGCHIDQVFGQGWAHQLGLDRVLPADKTQTALKSLWRYNFTPDVGPYRKQFKAGRWYAMPGEAGLIMCTFPKGGEREARGGKPGHGFAGYFNECMNGFEYQAAWHMIAEGLVQEGLAVTRAVHDRYHPSRRNPYNEIECSDHYARSMASHGVFVSLCGFECHGPKQHLGFAPKITPEDFRAPFIAAEGWGTFSQRIEDGKLTAELEVRHGKLPLASLALECGKGDAVTLRLGSKPLPAALKREGKRVLITLDGPVEIAAGDKLVTTVS
jgi:non-lysosomal glucosylceramidase